MKTYQPRKKEIKRNWHLMDAKGKVLGRLSTEIATVLMGKNKPSFSSHLDSGDFVVLINAEKVEVTGKKSSQKVYRSHSGYPGGLKEVSFEKMSKEHPKRIISHAVSGMLPDNRLKTSRLKRLMVIVGDKNPYQDRFASKE